MKSFVQLFWTVEGTGRFGIGARHIAVSGNELFIYRPGEKHDITAVSLTDPRELELPRIGLITLRDPETGAEVLIDTEDRAERERYAGDRAQAAGARRRLFASLGVEEVALRTDRSYIQPLLAFFKARAGGRRRGS